MRRRRYARSARPAHSSPPRRPGPAAGRRHARQSSTSNSACCRAGAGRSDAPGDGGAISSLLWSRDGRSGDGFAGTTISPVPLVELAARSRHRRLAARSRVAQHLLDEWRGPRPRAGGRPRGPLQLGGRHRRVLQLRRGGQSRRGARLYLLLAKSRSFALATRFMYSSATKPWRPARPAACRPP